MDLAQPPAQQPHVIDNSNVDNNVNAAPMDTSATASVYITGDAAVQQ